LGPQRALIEEAAEGAARVESNYDGEINTDDSYVDLGHFARLIKTKFNSNTTVKNAAQGVVDSVNTTVIGKESISGNLIFLPGARYHRDFDSTTGISFYFPSHKDELKRHYFYNGFQMEWVAATGWDHLLIDWYFNGLVRAAQNSELPPMPSCSGSTGCIDLAMPLPGPIAPILPPGAEVEPPTINLLPNKLVCISSTSGGKVGTIPFGDEDILCHNMRTGEVTLRFDGSEQGLPAKADINAFHIREDGSILMSFDRPFSITGLGKIDDSDVVKFTPSANGQGTWELFFKGKRAQLAKAGEDIDAIFELSDGRIGVSTIGTANVKGVTKIKHSELFVFTPEQLGSATKGTWSRYFIGNQEGLTTTGENLWAAIYDDEENQFYLSTRGGFRVSGLRSNSSEIFTCEPTAENNRECTFNAFWNARDYGFGKENIDGLHVMTAPDADEVQAASFMGTERTTSQPSRVAVYSADEGGILPNTTRTVNFVVENLSASPESYAVTLTNSADWPMNQEHATLTLEPGEGAELAVEITHNGEMADESKLVLAVTAQSSSDIRAVEIIELGEPEFDFALYLPLIQQR